MPVGLETTDFACMQHAMNNGWLLGSEGKVNLIPPLIYANQ